MALKEINIALNTKGASAGNTFLVEWSTNCINYYTTSIDLILTSQIYSYTKVTSSINWNQVYLPTPTSSAYALVSTGSQCIRLTDLNGCIGNTYTSTISSGSAPTTTTTTLSPFYGVVCYAENEVDACTNPIDCFSMTGNGHTFCSSTIFTGAGWSSILSSIYKISYLGNWMQVSHTAGDTFATVTHDTGCVACTTTTTSTSTTTTTTAAVSNELYYSGIGHIRGTGSFYNSLPQYPPYCSYGSNWTTGSTSMNSDFTCYWTGSVVPTLGSTINADRIVNGVTVPGLIYTPAQAASTGGPFCVQSPLFVNKIEGGITSSLIIFPNTSVPVAIGGKIEYWSYPTSASGNPNGIMPQLYAITGSSYTFTDVSPYQGVDKVIHTFTSSGNFYYNTFTF